MDTNRRQPSCDNTVTGGADDLHAAVARDSGIAAEDVRLQGKRSVALLADNRTGEDGVMPHHARMTVDFFHDVVCCWCFNMSSRLRTLAQEYDLEIYHRTYVLQASTEEMQRRWGSPEQARNRILQHWEACREVSDKPAMLDVEAMHWARFDYPHGLQAALACKVAERMGGQSAHWDMFDALQRAHFSEARNIADPVVLLEIARSQGHDEADFAAEMSKPETLEAVEADRRYAQTLGIRTIPHIRIRETGTHLESAPLAGLREQLEREQTAFGITGKGS